MTKPLTIAVKRIYAPADRGDGARFLVDRLWPRGVSKDKAALTAWLRALSPSTALRDQFHHAGAASDAAWIEFCAAYHAELAAGGADIAAALAALDRALGDGPVTLLYAAKDEAHNNAVALRTWLERR